MTAMGEPLMRAILAITIVMVFAAFMMAVLLGLVNVQDSEVAKLVGAVFGYFTGLISTVFARYFTAEK